MRWLIIILITLTSCKKAKIVDNCNGQATLTIVNGTDMNMTFVVNETNPTKIEHGTSKDVTVNSGKVHINNYYVVFQKKYSYDTYIDLADCEKYSINLNK
jgi:hypothetical protein